MDEATRCDRLLLLREGRLLADESPEGLVARTGAPDAEHAFFTLIETEGSGMNPRLTLATARRVLLQVRADRRTLALMIAVPCVLIGLLAWIFNGTPVFDKIGAPLLGVFPFVVMLLITSVATLRERSSGTLERLLSTPPGKGDFPGGYALAFGALAVVQALVATGFTIWVCGLDVAGPRWLLVVVAMVDAVLGTATGLFVSAFARTEFQAVQFHASVRTSAVPLVRAAVAAQRAAPSAGTGL